MIGIFKANNSYNTFLLFVYGFLLKLHLFLQPVIPQPQQIDGFLYKALLSWLKPLAGSLPVIYSLITYILLYTQAISFNKLVTRQRLMQSPNYLTGMSYLLITSLFPQWNILSSVLIINTLLIWIWAKASTLYNNPNPKSYLFNMGAIIGVATFFYFPSLAFAALIIFALIITRPFKLTEWLITLLGIITPYYFLLSWVFLTDKWQKYKFPGFAVTPPQIYQTNWGYAAIIIVLFMAVIGVIFVQKNFRRQLIQTRKSWILVFLYLLIATFVPFVNFTYTLNYWILCAIPLSSFIGAAFFYINKKWISLTLHWIIIVFVIALNYFIKFL